MGGEVASRSDGANPPHRRASRFLRVRDSRSASRAAATCNRSCRLESASGSTRSNVGVGLGFAVGRGVDGLRRLGRDTRIGKARIRRDAEDLMTAADDFGRRFVAGRLGRDGHRGRRNRRAARNLPEYFIAHTVAENDRCEQDDRSRNQQERHLVSRPKNFAQSPPLFEEYATDACVNRARADSARPGEDQRNAGNSRAPQRRLSYVAQRDAADRPLRSHHARASGTAASTFSVGDATPRSRQSRDARARTLRTRKRVRRAPRKKRRPSAEVSAADPATRQPCYVARCRATSVRWQRI